VFLSLLIPLTWLLILGWQPGYLIPQGDYLKMTLIFQQELTRASGDWTQLLYWPGLGGGVRVHDVTGSLPIAALLAYFKTGFVTAANLQVFFIQLLFAYLCTNIATRLPAVIFKNQVVPSAHFVFLAGIMFAFLPIISWRITNGHESIIVGLFTLLTFMLLLLNEMVGKRSLVDLFVCGVALVHTFAYSSSFQLVYYNVLFGGPIILSLLFGPSGHSFYARTRWLIIPVLVFTTALMISMPKLYGILVNGLGEESSRVYGSNVVYSYTISTWQDWFSSIPWSKQFIPLERPAFLHHEINLPLGPIVLFLLLAKPTSTFFRMLAGLCLSMIVALAFSMDTAPLSTAMIKYLPLLDAFRVPSRAMLPFIVIASILSVAILFDLASRSASHTSTGFIGFVASAAFLVALLNNSLTNDLILITTAVILLVFRQKLSQAAYFIAFSLFVGGAISAFGERLHKPVEDPTIIAAVSPTRKIDPIQQEVSDLSFPLNRIHSTLANRNVGINSHFFWGLSSLSSYWIPTSRYSQLVMALEDVPYRATRSQFQNQPSAQGFDALNRLFNVAWELEAEQGVYQLKKLRATFGPAWISTVINKHSDWKSLASEIKTNSNPQELILLSTDAKTSGLGTQEPNCKIVEHPVIAITSFPYVINMDVAGDCYLTLPMNYTSILVAKNQDGVRLRTFPAYGTLLGIAVNSDTRQVSVAPATTTFPGLWFIQQTGFALLLVLAFLHITRPVVKAVGLSEPTIVDI